MAIALAIPRGQPLAQGCCWPVCWRGRQPLPRRPRRSRAGRPPIAELTAALQAKYDAVADFSADFEQRYAGGVLRTAVVEGGSVQIKKPGLMRWRYTWPEEKLFVSDAYRCTPTSRPTGR